jgi:hypothetical protein
MQWIGKHPTGLSQRRGMGYAFPKIFFFPAQGWESGSWDGTTIIFWESRDATKKTLKGFKI